MHRLALMDGYNEYVTNDTKAQMKIMAENYNNDKTYANFMRVSTNYLQLKTIYKQRKNHKLKEDWGAICSMIEGLPYSELITQLLNNLKR